jgi:hypothetical protein
MHLSPRCAAHSRRTGKPCRNGAIPNGAECMEEKRRAASGMAPSFTARTLIKRPAFSSDHYSLRSKCRPCAHLGRSGRFPHFLIADTAERAATCKAVRIRAVLDRTSAVFRSRQDHLRRFEEVTPDVVREAGQALISSRNALFVRSPESKTGHQPTSLGARSWYRFEARSPRVEAVLKVFHSEAGGRAGRFSAFHYLTPR